MNIEKEEENIIGMIQIEHPKNIPTKIIGAGIVRRQLDLMFYNILKQ